MLVETGRAEAHRILPDSGWVSKPIRNEQDVEETIELFRLSFERARVARAVRAGNDAPGETPAGPRELAGSGELADINP